MNFNLIINELNNMVNIFTHQPPTRTPSSQPGGAHLTAITAICVYLRSSAVNPNRSSFYGGMHMSVTITALWDQLYFSDTDLHGLTQINGFNNIINIFQPGRTTRNHRTQQPEVPT